MAEYLVSFRVASVDLALTEQQRRDSIYEKVENVVVWDETTSVLIFEADQNIDTLMGIMTRDLDPRYDMMLIRRIGYKNTVFWGAIKNELLLKSLMPEARRV